MSTSSSAGDYKPSSSEQSRNPSVTHPAPRAHNRGNGSTAENNSNSCSGNAFPPDAPYRSLYVGSRATGILVALTLIALSVVAILVPDLPGRWLSAILSPSINSAFVHAVDLWGIYRVSQRSPPLLRLFWDGGVAVGIIISASFLVSWTARLAGNREQTVVNGVDRVVLGAICVAGMLFESLIHISFSITGFRGWRQLRAARRTSAV